MSRWVGEETHTRRSVTWHTSCMPPLRNPSLSEDVTMSRSLLLAALALSLTVGCKKKPPETMDDVNVSASGPVDKKPVPEHIETMKANFARVHFGFDAAELDAEAEAALAAIAALMAQHMDVKIEIQGHADDRGTTDYNLALGQRRAESVRKYLAAVGVAPSRLGTISYGEERPLASGQSETAWSQNRRAEFRLTWGGDAAVAGTTN